MGDRARANMIELEQLVIHAAEWLRLILESASVIVIALGFLKAVYLLGLKLIKHQEQRTYTAVRLEFAKHLALGLEFQLGADIVATAVSPTWEQIGQLAAIAVIRTGLNFFLNKEMERESKELGRSE